MAKAKSTKKGRKAGKTKSARKAQPRRKTAKKRAATRKPARRKAPAAKPRGKKAPGRKPAAPKARGKSPIRKKTRPNRKAKPVRKAKALRKARPVRKAKPVRKPAPARATKPARKPAPRRPAAAEPVRKAPALDRERKRLVETDENGPTAPSSLGYEGGSSAARSGQSELRESLTQHTETGPALTGGDIDANWQDAYAVGDEAPGGDNPTPDQDRVDDIGRALGVQYNDNEELKGSDKIIERDRHRWELDPASSDDYQDRSREE